MDVQSHFAKVQPEVLATYQRLLQTARTFGPVVEDPKKTSIHLVRDTAFAGVAARRDALILTIKSSRDIRGARVAKRLQTSPNRWHFEVRLETPADVDRQLTTWLEAAYALSSRTAR